ncbi:MAG: NAD(P)/FAD-dependent oxidoreductase [Solirubrobacteraceae bacterium]
MTAPTDNGHHNDTHLQVLVAGGGVAALETVLALRALAGRRVSIALLAPGADLLYRPVTVAEAFGRAEARSFAIDEILAQQAVEHRHDAVVRVRPDAGTVLTAGSDELHYDALVIATGAQPVRTLPGALAFGGRQDVAAMRELLDDLVAGRAASVAFTVGRGHLWTMPIYELALLTGAHLREHGSRARITLVTPEEAPLELFGPEAEQTIRPMLDSVGIEVRCSAMPAAVKPRELVLAGGGGVMADRVVTLPDLEGPRIPGLPCDPHGFILTDAHGRVANSPGVYAAGDAVSFPLKQGGLATQQADAVAEHIAHRAGAPITPRPFRPVLRGLLITEGAPVYLRSEPQRLSRPSSVAIDDHRVRHPSRTASLASDQALWWPPAKIAGRYLAPYLATARPHALTHEPMADRRAVPGSDLAGDEFADAVALVLMLADGDAEWGDYGAALAALDAAEALEGALPPEYEAKRRLWMGAARGLGRDVD